MKLNQSVIICILARDCREALERNIPKVENLRSYFSESYIIVVENDSKDGTKEILQNWKNKSDGVILDLRNFVNNTDIPIPEGVMPAASRRRIQKMADCRNRYLNIIKQENITSDYVILIDIDLDDFYPETIVQAIINAPDDWNALYANGIQYSKIFNKICLTKYYDTFAYVAEDSVTDELTYREQWLNSDIVKNLLKKKKYLSVKSAFGGIGIYHYKAIMNSCYTIKNNYRSTSQEVICEHIILNENGLKFGKNYIVSDMITLYQQIPLFSIYSLLPKTIFLYIWEIFNHKKFTE